jgi:hypothetical protein
MITVSRKTAISIQSDHFNNNIFNEHPQQCAEVKLQLKSCGISQRHTATCASAQSFALLTWPASVFSARVLQSRDISQPSAGIVGAATA